MIQKRPFGDEKSHEQPWKQSRHFECSYQLSSFVDIVGRNDVAHKSSIHGEGFLNKCQYGDRLANENEFEDLRSEAAVGFSFFPELFEYGHSTRQQSIKEQLYSPSFDILPRKRVSIGPDYQAVVPEQCAKIEDVDNERMLGTCVNSMLEESYISIKVGRGRADCSCQDKGSLRCTRQHIGESRENLIATLGEKAFMELGFCDMGENVASKWIEEEEDVFNEVVISNPASLGKNFWDHLSVVFPSRTKKEIVSYYFNVFMLRKRGEQNRFDPSNIDSDVDEWHDSVVASPHHQFDDDLEMSEDEMSEDDEMSYDNNPSAAKVDDKVDDDLHDDSCTSYEVHLITPESCYPDTKQVCRIESDNNNNSQFNGFGFDDNMENCDTKHWDVGFRSSSKSIDVEFLPTCSMIEEVFGDETWKNKENDTT
ncbi:hypothetical protein ACHQM5_005752 [Ranunculus cassubicifolius]